MTDAFRAALRDWRDGWARLSPGARATTVFLGLMIAGGAILRIQGIAFPPRFTFDEQHFVPNARSYLAGAPDENDHPPLGKLFIAVAILLLGDNPLGWRTASLILGLQTLMIGYWLARVMFSDRRAGWFAAAFLAADGFFVSYSRTALLDGGLTCLVLWSLLAAVTARSWRGVLASAVLVGLATSVKWSGALAIVPAAAAILTLRRAPRWTILLLAAAPVVHLALWLGALGLSGRPVDLHGLATLMLALFRRHVALGKNHNPLASPWWTWLVLYHPIVVKLSDLGTKRCYASSGGNPVLFAATTLSLMTAFVGALALAVRSRFRRLAPAGWSPRTVRAVALLALGWFALLAPWIVGRGTYVFWYHYLPSYGFGLILLGGLAARVERRAPRAIAVFVGLALGVAIYFAPVWGEFPLGDAVANRRLIFLPWRP
jgi:dolichyl-phosphate-mannose-protein mannosyltransferase